MYALILPMTLFGSLGAFFFKKAAAKTAGLFHLLRCPAFYFGGMLYVIGAVLNIVLLRYVDYSIAYPMTAVTYIWTALLAHFLLKERITTQKIYGILAIVVGVLFLSM